MVTVFAWGYDRYGGWGNAVPQLIKAFDAVEKSRGFKPPIFVDVRAKREVRALGFRGDAFEKALNKIGDGQVGARPATGRYRWLRGLGNIIMVDPQSPPRLINKEEVSDLLQLVRAARDAGRRVLFFCSDPSPFGFPGCHRRGVAQELRRVSRKQRVDIRVEEWPGGEPGADAIPVRISAEATDRLVTRGGKSIDLGEQMPSVQLLALPHGSIVRAGDGKREIVASVCPAVLRAQRWALPSFLVPVSKEDTPESLWPDVLKGRQDTFPE